MREKLYWKLNGFIRIQLYSKDWVSPKESIDWLLQDHHTGIICFDEVTTIQAGVFNFRDLLVISQNPSKYRRWNFDDYIIRLKNYNFLVQDIRKTRVAMPIIFTVFTEWTILWIHQGNGVILQSLIDWFTVEEVYCTTSLEEADATSGPVMPEEVWKGEWCYLR